LFAPIRSAMMKRMPVAELKKCAERSPSAAAIMCGSDSLTYAEFDDRSDAVAKRLRASGIGPGAFVALSFERSLDMMVALWGVVKSGAAYIPVDPAYPDARIAHMAASARWDAWLAQEHLLARLGAIPAAAPPRALHDDDAAAPRGPATRDATADDPLYAIFTSGSTGDPKAAVVFRRGFDNLLAWYIDAMGIDADTRALVFSSFSFDLTQKNLFAPLMRGGTIVLQPPGPFDLRAIEAEIARHGATHVNTTPSAFYPLVDAAAARGFAPLASLRAVVLGGEPIAVERLRAWLSHPGTRAFVANTYGPTECTDICAWHRLDRANLDAYPFVPIGRPIPNVSVVLLDEQLRPVPPGETGELCIAGVGVGGGYLRDAARTADRFIPNPVPELAPGPVLYRTGDVARMDADGVIEFRGRLDHQVKVRGFRVELGEIERALASHPAVREAVVTASHAGGESATLAAWLVAKGAPCEAESLRAHLADRLPGYMIPHRFEWLETLPMTPNAKVDRIALQRRAAAREVEAPTRAAADHEREVLDLWSEALGHPVSDPTVNFFDAGGNSIQLAVLHEKLCAWSGRAMPITDLFLHTTARAQAAHLRGGETDARRRAILDRARRQRAIYSQSIPRA
jgi:amino acid adenylation domain-containing protein